MPKTHIFDFSDIFLNTNNPKLPKINEIIKPKLIALQFIPTVNLPYSPNTSTAVAANIVGIDSKKENLKASFASHHQIPPLLSANALDLDFQLQESLLAYCFCLS